MSCDRVGRWEAPPSDILLPGGQVHLWRASLLRPPVERDALWYFLSPDEQTRAERFRFDVHRRRFIVGRGLLRWLHGRYLSIAPQDIQFTYGEHNKPALANQPLLQFNVSHSHEGMLLAFTWETAVGVDIEQVRRWDGMDGIARRFFSPAENEQYGRVAESAKPDAFFNCWTRKEAFIKAVGDGLSFPLHAFEVALRPGEPAALLTVRGSKREAARWSMLTLDPFPGYRGALILEGQMPDCVFWDGDQIEVR